MGYEHYVSIALGDLCFVVCGWVLRGAWLRWRTVVAPPSTPEPTIEAVVEPEPPVTPVPIIETTPDKLWCLLYGADGVLQSVRTMTGTTPAYLERHHGKVINRYLLTSQDGERAVYKQVS